MTPRTGFAYAQARLQARYGGRPDDVLWRTLEASRTAAHALALTRGGPLASWTDGLAEAADPHRIEPHLRARWRQQVETIASWLPLRWQPAARWFAALVELPLADAPAAGERAAQWRDEWHRRLPADAGDAARLAEPAALLMPRLADATALRAAGAEPTRRALERLLRRQAGTAVAVFACLALLALELERLCAASSSCAHCSTAQRGLPDAAPASLPLVRARHLARRPRRAAGRARPHRRRRIADT